MSKIHQSFFYTQIFASDDSISKIFNVSRILCKYITHFSQLVVFQLYVCVGIYKVTSSQELRMRNLYRLHGKTSLQHQTCKECVDTKEVVANEEDSFIQRETADQTTYCCIIFKHVHVRIYNRYIRDLDMQFMRSETGKIGKMLCIKGGETV